MIVQVIGGPHDGRNVEAQDGSLYLDLSRWPDTEPEEVEPELFTKTKLSVDRYSILMHFDETFRAYYLPFQEWLKKEKLL